MRELDSLIKAHYRRQRLTEDRVDAILERAKPSRASERVWYLRVAALAAVLVAGFVFTHVQITEADLTTRVLAEIAMNHNKRLAVEVAAADYDELQAAMDRLDFPIQPPAGLRADYELLGARYCSIHGKLAAQVKIRARDTGRLLTLYATGLTPELANISRQETVYDDVRIEMWTEGGVFFGLADGT